MPFSDKTYERIKSLGARVKDIMAVFDCSEDRAWVILAADSAQKALAVSEKIDRRQERVIDAEDKANSAYLNTRRSKLKEVQADNDE